MINANDSSPIQHCTNKICQQEYEDFKDSLNDKLNRHRSINQVVPYVDEMNHHNGIVAMFRQMSSEERGPLYTFCPTCYVRAQRDMAAGLAFVSEKLAALLRPKQ